MHINTGWLLVQDLILDMSIGVYDTEKEKSQKVLINADIELHWPQSRIADSLDTTRDYMDVVTLFETLVAGEHIHLVEHLLEQAAKEMAAWPDVKSGTIEAYKLEVLREPGRVGCRLNFSSQDLRA